VGPNYTFIDCQHSNREGGVQGIMFLMRRGSLQALGRLRGITAAAPGSAEGFAHLLGMSDGGNPELPRHQVQWALGEGRRPANIDQQLQQHAPMGGWTSWLVHEATSSQRHHPSLTAAAARFSSTSPSRTMHSSSSSSSKAGSQDGTKMCINPQCGKVWELRHFKPRKNEADGLAPLCNGCKYRQDTYRRLIAYYGRSKTQ